MRISLSRSLRDYHNIQLWYDGAQHIPSCRSLLRVCYLGTMAATLPFSRVPIRGGTYKIKHHSGIGGKVR